MQDIFLFEKKQQETEGPERQEVHIFKIHSTHCSCPAVLLYLPSAPLASTHL